MSQRSYYQASASDFIDQDEKAILGELVNAHGYNVDATQTRAWQHQISAIKSFLKSSLSAFVLFEFAIPRMGKRADVIVLVEGLILVIEYKVGSDDYAPVAKEQSLDYAIDLKNFHEGSHSQKIVPILVATKAPRSLPNDQWFDDGVSYVQCANDDSLAEIVNHFITNHGSTEIDHQEWITSSYKPTPTICEAAQALYAGHDVSDISRSDAGAINLSRTATCISQIIEGSKASARKSICFVTGVPGSGKTLAGLNIASQRFRLEGDEHSIFLSGNGPLVAVLKEALARNKVDRANNSVPPERVSKSSALRATRKFIQNIHHFRDNYIIDRDPPVDRVVVFDEAQRAWTKDKLAKFMREKKQIDNFSMSEPDFLLSVMDRHQDWCTVVCIIGGGQEINTGEAGIGEWFDALRSEYDHWGIFVSEYLTGSEHFGGEDLQDHMKGLQVKYKPDLHLDVCIRSFRSEKVSNFVHALLEGDKKSARSLISTLNDYPVTLTRDINVARRWLRSMARGSERYGLVASSNAQRLRAIGADVRVKIDPATWFLNDNLHVRSSYYLEDIATEFDIQGLELDWVGVCWDANLRRNGKVWSFHRFRGTKWENVKVTAKKAYLVNAYRVLLTRARQGMVICIPEGDASDPTRLPEYYDPIFSYLRSCGIPEMR